MVRIRVNLGVVRGVSLHFNLDLNLMKMEAMETNINIKILLMNMGIIRYHSNHFITAWGIYIKI